MEKDEISQGRDKGQRSHKIWANKKSIEFLKDQANKAIRVIIFREKSYEQDQIREQKFKSLYQINQTRSIENILTGKFDIRKPINNQGIGIRKKKTYHRSIKLCQNQQILT